MKKFVTPEVFCLDSKAQNNENSENKNLDSLFSLLEILPKLNFGNFLRQNGSQTQEIPTKIITNNFKNQQTASALEKNRISTLSIINKKIEN